MGYRTGSSELEEHPRDPTSVNAMLHRMNCRTQQGELFLRQVKIHHLYVISPNDNENVLRHAAGTNPALPETEAQAG